MELTPEQAIAVLSNATAQLSATREQHDLILKSLAVLKNLILAKVE